jgi:predicted molibdopterin-dependent oxidoreductase YjgC
MTRGLLQRLPGAPRPTLHFELDGAACAARQGDTVLTAVLTQATQLRQAEASGAPRAGFCLMGACQDCWVQTREGRRLRACSTLLEEGMSLVTRPVP